METLANARNLGYNTKYRTRRGASGALFLKPTICRAECHSRCKVG